MNTLIGRNCVSPLVEEERTGDRYSSYRSLDETSHRYWTTAAHNRHSDVKWRECAHFSVTLSFSPSNDIHFTERIYPREPFMIHRAYVPSFASSVFFFLPSSSQRVIYARNRCKRRPLTSLDAHPLLLLPLPHYYYYYYYIIILIINHQFEIMGTTVLLWRYNGRVTVTRRVFVTRM